MNNFEKIMEITRPGREVEPLWEPCPFELAESRLKLPKRKILCVKTPSGSPKMSRILSNLYKVENPTITKMQDEIFCVTFDEIAQKYHMLRIDAERYRRGEKQ